MPDSTSHASHQGLSESEQIAALTEELETANRSRHDFLIGMNHRFRTPLTGALGMLELLANTRLDEEQNSCVQSALSSGRSLMRVFDDLLDFCRAEAGELVLACENFSPVDLIDDVVGEFGAEADSKRVALHQVASPSTPGSIQGDPDRLRQVLRELLENALRFTSEGQIHVGVRPLSDSIGEGKLLFWVEDSGEGMTDDQLMQVFDLKLGTSAQQDMKIGLPAVRRTLDAMGGMIDMESEVGSGTTARFTIPTQARWKASVVESMHMVPTQIRSQGGVRRPARVLVVEDDLVNQRVTLGYLKIVGYDGTVVDSGEEALRALADGSFDLVLMDKMMPGMDGIETTRAIRAGMAGVQNPEIPIIALTADVSVEARRECLASGMNDYLTKPIRKKDIDPVIRAWLPPNLRPARQSAA